MQPNMIQNKAGGGWGWGAFCALCASDWWWSQTSWLRIRRSSPALNNFPYRKPARCLVTFWVLCGWQRTPLKIDLSSTLPEAACSLKMSLPFPSKHRHHYPRYSPCLLTQQLPKQKPASHLKSRFPLLGKGQKCLESRRKQPFTWILAKTALLKQTDFKEKGVGLWLSLLPPEDQLRGTMYVKVLCNLQIPGTITGLCLCSPHFQNCSEWKKWLL